GAFSTTCERYLPIPSCVIPRETVIPVFGTSEDLLGAFGCDQIASAQSTPTLPLTTSNAAVNSMSEMWYPPRSTCIRPGTVSSDLALLYYSTPGRRELAQLPKPMIATPTLSFWRPPFLEPF